MHEADTGHRGYLERKTFGSLDGIRALSIVAVIFHHGCGRSGLGMLARRGYLGVDMFFVLSGFLIVTLLLRERDRHGRISLRDFYARRTLRIMPLYYGVVALYALLFGLVLTDGHNGRHLQADLPYLLTYTANWTEIHGSLAVAWSLAAEEQFYLLWPPIQRSLRSPWATALLLLGLILLSQAVAFGLFDPFLHAVFGWSPREPKMLRGTTFTPILLGVLIAHGLHYPMGFQALRRALGFRFMPALLLPVILLCVRFLPDPLTPTTRLLLQLLMGALLIACVVREDHALATFFRYRAVVRIGVLSYGLYLWHMFAHMGVERLSGRGMPEFLVFPLLLLTTWLIAEASYRFYEQPFLKLKQRFSR